MILPMHSAQLYSWAAFVCDATAGVGCLYILICAACVLRFPDQGKARREGEPPLTILKPLHGYEPELARRLSNFCAQHYGAPIQIVCGIADERDAAAPSVKQLMSQRTAADVELVVDGHDHGSNRKISNLANMLPHARHEILVFSDSDIEIDRDCLGKVARRLEQEGVGAVTCLYHGVAGPGVWSRQAALTINSHLLPSMVLALTFKLARPCFGSLIAIRRGMLARIGGFESFADCLADDYAIGTAIRAAGKEVAVSSFTVGHFCYEKSWRDLLAHELRAAQTIRNLRPISYCGTFMVHPFPMALLAASFSNASPLLLAALALTCRLLLCRCIEHRFGAAQQAYWLIPFNDLFSFGVYVLSFVQPRVSWRGTSYQITPDGHLVVERDGTP
ncbi:MAG: glycosyltransferase [Beijerinckiaceae bacterium]|nr:MAG: glycosyltransferase [Beijerinckiaceae bacterium]